MAIMSWLITLSVVCANVGGPAASKEPWKGMLPEVPESLATINAAWIEGYRDQLEQQLLAFVIAYELDATDEEVCRQELYRLWVEEARHYHNTFDRLARLRLKWDEDGDGEIDEAHTEEYKAAFFKLRDDAPLRVDRLLHSLEATLPPGDHAEARAAFHDLAHYFSQLRVVVRDDYVRESSAGRNMKRMRRACRASLSESGLPVPHLVQARLQHRANLSEAAQARAQAIEGRAVSSQTQRTPGVPAYRRTHSSSSVLGPTTKGPGESESLGAEHHPVLQEWISLIAEFSKRQQADPKTRALALAMLDGYRERLRAYVESRQAEYEAAEATTSWSEYRRLHEPLNEPLEAMTVELKLRLDAICE